MSSEESSFQSRHCFSDILFPYRSPSPRPHPDPTQRTRNGPKTAPETEPNGAETEPNGAEIKLFGVGRAGGLSGVGVVREKENHYIVLGESKQRQKGPFAGQSLLFPCGCEVRRNWSRSTAKRARIGAGKAQSAPIFQG